VINKVLLYPTSTDSIVSAVIVTLQNAGDRKSALFKENQLNQ
jgi:hypothetical protein